MSEKPQLLCRIGPTLHGLTIDTSQERFVLAPSLLLRCRVQATFFQKVIICAVAGFLAASLIQWAKVFVEGADDALNKGYKHHAVMGP
jgi:hypothetical protein